jgi:hypothetical protein
MSINFPALPIMVIVETLPIVNYDLLEQFAFFNNYLYYISGEKEFDTSVPKEKRSLAEEESE